MVAFYGDVLRLLNIVDALQYGQTVADTSNSHLLEIIMLEGNQGFADDLVFCWVESSS
jgi:hypothetical protein